MPYENFFFRIVLAIEISLRTSPRSQKIFKNKKNGPAGPFLFETDDYQIAFPLASFNCDFQLS